MMSSGMLLGREDVSSTGILAWVEWKVEWRRRVQGFDISVEDWSSETWVGKIRASMKIRYYVRAENYTSAEKKA